MDYAPSPFITIDLRILVLDLDPQASATMFLNHLHAIDVNTTVAQAMLQNVSRRINRRICGKSEITGVDLIPASIEDAFIASAWDELCRDTYHNKKCMIFYSRILLTS